MAFAVQRPQTACSSTTRASAPLAVKHLPSGLCFRAIPQQAVQSVRFSAGKASFKAPAVSQADQAEAAQSKLPPGYHNYETMLIMKPSLSDDERDKELAKFEAYLNKEECLNINALVRGRSRLAYPIRKENEGIYVLYNYSAKRNTAKAIQLLLSKPEAGSEDKVLRHISFCK